MSQIPIVEPISEQVPPLVDRKRISTQDLYRHLKDMILSFEIYPGSRVTENKLARYFQVSRTPVREALQRLETEGFLTIMAKQGCFIRDINIDEITQYYQLRMTLEMMSLETACINMSDKKLNILAEEWSVNQNLIDHATPEELVEKDECFHVALAEGGGNKVLASYLKDVNNHIRVARRLDYTESSRARRSYEEHEEIIQVLLKRDLASAHWLIKQHISQSQEFVKTLTLPHLARNRTRSDVLFGGQYEKAG